jgi:phospholipid/cholesterol/gamma-HCH transport system substrate-binding protein
VKAPVKLRGVQIGKVASIEFDPQQPRQILIGIEVEKAAPVTATTTAKLGYQGITGLSFIDLSDEGTGPVSAARDPASRIELRPSLLDQLANGGPRLLTGVNDVAVRLSRLLSDENQREVTRTLTQLGQASGQVSQLVQDLRPAVLALKPLTDKADHEMQRADAVLHSAGQTLQKFEGLATESTLLAQDLRQRAVALDRLTAAANQLQTTTQRLELALIGVDKPRTQALVDTLGASAQSVQRAAANVGSLAEQPQGILFGRPALPPGPGEAGFDASEGKGR